MSIRRKALLIINILRSTIHEHRRIILTAVIALIFMVPAVYVAALKINHEQSKTLQEQILGTSATESPEPTPTPTPTPSASPTPRDTRIAPTPTPSPVSSPSPSPSPTPTSASSSSSDNTTSQPSPTPSPSPAPSPSPSPQALVIEVKVDYSGFVEKSADTYTTNFSENQTAWTVVQAAIGTENLQYTDYGGDLGIFITGINGVVPTGNNFWLFKVNGESASVGVSSYIVQEGDKLEFAISSF